MVSSGTSIHAPLPAALRQILRDRGLAEPNGRPLYAYRFTAKEIATLKEPLTQILARAGPTCLDTPWCARAFVAIACHWFLQLAGRGRMGVCTALRRTRAPVLPGSLAECDVGNPRRPPGVGTPGAAKRPRRRRISRLADLRGWPATAGDPRAPLALSMASSCARSRRSRRRAGPSGNAGSLARAD